MKRKQRLSYGALDRKARAQLLDAASTIVKRSERLKDYDMQVAALRAEAIRYIMSFLALFLVACGGAGSGPTSDRPSILDEPLPDNCQTFLRLAAECIEDNPESEKPALQKELQTTVTWWLDIRKNGTDAELNDGCGYALEDAAYQWFCPGMHP